MCTWFCENWFTPLPAPPPLASPPEPPTLPAEALPPDPAAPPCPPAAAQIAPPEHPALSFPVWLATGPPLRTASAGHVSACAGFGTPNATTPNAKMPATAAAIATFVFLYIYTR